MARGTQPEGNRSKSRGRTAQTNPDPFRPTHPQFQQEQKTGANRAGPGSKSTRKARGDRRDTGPASY
jgi:hypothetical protein